MREFNFCAPASLKEALELLAEYKDRALIIAGGTDVVPLLKERRLRPEYVININKLRELRYCGQSGGKVRIGALSTFADLEKDTYIRDSVKSLHYCCRNVGSPQIRNLGTLGGNLVNASVAGDSLTTFISLDASVALESSRGKREMKLVDFYANCPKTQLAPDELLTEICFDTPDRDTATAAYKLGRRKALAIVVVGLAALIERDSSNRVRRANVVLGAVSKIPLHMQAVEEYLTGKPLTEETFKPCGGMLSAKIREMIPKRESVFYKSESIKCIAERTFGQILSAFSSR